MKRTEKRIGTLPTSQLLALDKKDSTPKPTQEEEDDEFASKGVTAVETKGLFSGLRFFLGREVCSVMHLLCNMILMCVVCVFRYLVPLLSSLFVLWVVVYHGRGLKQQVVMQMLVRR